MLQGPFSALSQNLRGDTSDTCNCVSFLFFRFDVVTRKRIHIPHPGRKFPNPYVHKSTVGIKDYDGIVRQIIMKGNGREKPTFIITNDFDVPVELVMGNYARRWRVENGIAEAVKFFNLNSLSSPILTKVHFDVAMTMVADTLYTMLAQKLRGFESCDAPSSIASS